MSKAETKCANSIAIFNNYSYTNKVAEDIKWEAVPEKKESKKHSVWDSEMDFFFSVLGYAGKFILSYLNAFKKYHIIIIVYLIFFDNLVGIGNFFLVFTN